MEAKEKFSYSKYIELAGLITGGLSVLYSFITEHFKLELLFPIIIFLWVVLGITVYKRKHFQKRYLILVLSLNIALQLCAVFLYIFKNNNTNLCTTTSTKYGICICKFDIGKTDDFSYVLSSDLADKNIQMYNGLVNTVDTFISATQINEIPTFNAIIKNSCFSRGLLVFGRRSENSKLFICSIYLNLGLLDVLNSLEVMYSNGIIIKLKNPSELFDGINMHSKYISDFILGLFQYLKKDFKSSSLTFERIFIRSGLNHIDRKIIGVFLGNSFAYTNELSKSDSIFKMLKNDYNDSILDINLIKLSNILKTKNSKYLKKINNIQNDLISVDSIYSLNNKKNTEIENNINFKEKPDTSLKNIILNTNLSKNKKNDLNKKLNNQSITCNSCDITPLKIKNQIWSNNNLCIKVFRNGDSIPEAKTKEEWQNAAFLKLPMWCNPTILCDDLCEIGLLYNKYALLDNRGLLPEGWYIPEFLDWEILFKNYDVRSVKSTKYWNDQFRGTNQCNFNALPCGQITPEGNFKNVNSGSYFWCEKGGLFLQGANIYGEFDKPEAYGMSIRCVKKYKKTKKFKSKIIYSQPL